MATFTNLKIASTAPVGTDKVLSFTATSAKGTSLSVSTSPAFAITPIGASLSVETQPAAAAVDNTAFPNKTVVHIKDATNALVGTGADGQLTVTASLQAGTGTLGGTVSVSAVNGVATFTDLKISGAGAVGSGKVLRFSATGSAGALTTVDTAPAFSVSPQVTSLSLSTHN